MLDPKLLRKKSSAKQVATTLQSRGVDFDYQQYLELEEQRKHLQVKTEKYQNEQKKIAKKIGLAKKDGKSKEVTQMLEKANMLKKDLDTSNKALNKVQIEMEAIQLGLPNLLHESVTIGDTDEKNCIVYIWGDPPDFSFTVKDHVSLGEQLGLLDMSAASKLAGSRFMVLHRDLAELHRALIQFMLDVHTREHGYQEVYVPYLANVESLQGTGQLPKFEKELFRLSGDSNYHLIPTAEVPLTNLARDTIFKSSDLPLRYVTHTPCFRSEAGSYGKDTRGIIRQHQFEKVEMVYIVEPEESWATLEILTKHAQRILEDLELPYRTLSLCSGDLGFSSAKTYDIEVWFPGQDCYREVSSCSNMTDFQARRIQARVRKHDNEKPILVHTLNGSGLAVGRTLAAIMENYQTEDGKVRVPDKLISYMKGKDIVGI